MRRTTAAEEAGAKAFLFTLEGVTPHTAAPEFLLNFVIKKLERHDKKEAARLKRPFWIDHVKLTNCQLVVPVDSPLRSQAAATASSVPRDPVTGEPMMDDSQFVITGVVNLGPGPGEGSDETAPNP